MGYGIETLPQLLKKLEHSRKDWCLVAVDDPENPTPASRQLEGLLDDLDEDSGTFFDFYLPGYAAPRKGDVARWGDEMSRFDRRLFRDFRIGIEHLPASRWRYNGDCSFLLFQTFRRLESHSDSCRNLVFVADYNLDDIVRNGQSVNQFLMRMRLLMEEIGRADISTVKNGLDEVYRELIMPPENRTPDQEQRLREGTVRLVHSHPEREYVFISYSTKDKDQAIQVRDLLEKTCGVGCWMAPRDIPTGSNYAYVIEHAISRCAIFLLLVSRHSLQSVWVNKEVLYAIGRLQAEGRFRAAWLSESFDLEQTRSGMAFALQDIQIDDSISRGDPSEILGRFLACANVTAYTFPVHRWRDALIRYPSLTQDEEIRSRCPWNLFGIQDWGSVLRAMSKKDVDPKVVIPFESLSPDGWANLLSKAPCLSDHCRKWDDFSMENWLVLLLARPEFAEKCGIWKKFRDCHWEQLLRVRPELKRFRTGQTTGGNK